MVKRMTGVRRILALSVLILTAHGCASVPLDSLPAHGSLVPGGSHFYSLTHDGQERNYLLHIPPHLDRTRKSPLVVVLHSAFDNARLIAERTRMSEKADAEQFIVVYPNGTGWAEQRFLTWNSGHCCAMALSAGVDDTGFVMAVIDKLERRLPIDPSRIYLTGFSNGAMLAHRIAATHAPRIAAVAAVSGNLGGRLSDVGPMVLPPTPASPMSVLAIHGRRDRQVPYDGGRTDRTFGIRVDLSVPESMRFWAEANRCESIPEIEKNGEGTVTVSTYRCPRTNTEVKLFTLEEGGHAWPGGERVEGFSLETFVIRFLLDKPSDELSATDTIWNFFRRHSKPASVTTRRDGNNTAAP